MPTRAWAVLSAVVVSSAIGSITWGTGNVCYVGTNVTLGGSGLLAFIDTNGNDVPDQYDCMLHGKANMSATVDDGTATSETCFNASQQDDGSSPQVLGCEDQLYRGTTKVDTGNQQVNATGQVEVLASSNANGNAALATGSAAGHMANFPVWVTKAQVNEVNNGQIPIGFGEFCNEGGLAVKATAGGVSGVVPFLPTAIPGFGNFYCGTVPFPTDQSSAQPLPLCFPYGPDGNAAFKFEGGETELVKLQLVGLPPCGKIGAPTASGWGLLGIATALLALGTWLLRRRAPFGAALPRI